MSDAVELAEVPQLFERWLAGRPLAERSRREYARNVRAYCAWLAATPDRDGWQGDPLTDALARDHATRDFRRYLQVEKRAAASTVNLALASLDALYRCLGLGCPHVRRDKPSLAAPRALDEAGQRRLLRAAEGAPHETSTEPAASGTSLMWPRSHSTFSTPALRWFSRARASISSVMSRP